MASSGYTKSQILLHWLIAALVLFQLIFGESIAETIEAVEKGTIASPFDRFFGDMHYWAGLAILALVAIRLWLRAITGAPPPQGNGWISVVAKFSHAIFYAVLVLMPVSGLLAFYVGDPYGEIHELGKPILFVLIALHACAAFYHQYWLKDGSLRRIFIPRN